MGCRRTGRRVQVIAPLERGNNAALTAPLRLRTQGFRGPGKVAFVQAQLCQGIGAMGIEAGRDDDKLRLKSRQRRQDYKLESAAEVASPCARGKRHIDDV